MRTYRRSLAKREKQFESVDSIDPHPFKSRLRDGQPTFVGQNEEWDDDVSLYLGGTIVNSDDDKDVRFGQRPPPNLPLVLPASWIDTSCYDRDLQFAIYRNLRTIPVVADDPSPFSNLFRNTGYN